MTLLTLESDIALLNQLTAALTAAVSISDIDNAIHISTQREALLKRLVSEKNPNRETQESLRLLCKKILEKEKTMIQTISFQKAEIESKLKNQVNSNKAMSRYQQNR